MCQSQPLTGKHVGKVAAVRVRRRYSPKVAMGCRTEQTIEHVAHKLQKLHFVFTIVQIFLIITRLSAKQNYTHQRVFFTGLMVFYHYTIYCQKQITRIDNFFCTRVTFSTRVMLCCVVMYCVVNDAICILCHMCCGLAAVAPQMATTSAMLS